MFFLVNVSGENCDFGGNPCKCSDDMSFVLYKGCMKDRGDLDMFARYGKSESLELTVAVFDQNKCGICGKTEEFRSHKY